MSSIASEASLVDAGSSLSDKQKEEPLVDDDLYCLRSRFVYFEVERCIFHVPTYRFSDESHVFAGMFNLPQPIDSAGDVEGSSRQNPISLPANIRREEFRNFLKALYPLPVCVELELTTDEWISVLRLSTFWYFLKYREMAIGALEKAKELSPLEKILFGREFKIRSWVVNGYSALVSRDETLSQDDVLLIEYDMAFTLFRLREKHFRRHIHSEHIVKAVEDAFTPELDTILAFELEHKVIEPLEVPMPTESMAVNGDRVWGEAPPAGVRKKKKH